MRRLGSVVVTTLVFGVMMPSAPAVAAGTPILGPQQVSTAGAQYWAFERNATTEFISLAPLFWELGPQRGGVRPEVAYAQSAKETGFGRFGGSVDPSFRNPCGMKTTEGGGDGDPNAHKRFASWTEGITACLDHLALYAGAAGYPRGDTPDPRHFPFLFGTAPTVEDLGGRWAPSPTYGISIVQDYLLPMEPVPAPPVVDVPPPQPPYWGGWDIARSLATSFDGSGGYTLDAWGGVHPWGGVVEMSGVPYWSGWDIARGIALDPDGPGGYTLDGWGGVHAWGGAAPATGVPYWSGWDIARGIVIKPDLLGGGGYTLDGWGGVHPWGGAPPVSGIPYWYGWDIARDIDLVGESAGGHTLDAWGGVHAWGGAVQPGGAPYWGGWSGAQGLSFEPDGGAGVPGYTLNIWGGVFTWDAA